MASGIYFVQGCPICGRRLNIRLEYLGRRLRCEHCRGQFVAQDPANNTSVLPQTPLRTQELQDNASGILPPQQFPHPR